MEHASSPEGYVQSKVSAVAARLLKRGWLVYMFLPTLHSLMSNGSLVSGTMSCDNMLLASILREVLFSFRFMLGFVI